MSSQIKLPDLSETDYQVQESAVETKIRLSDVGIIRYILKNWFMKLTC